MKKLYAGLGGEVTSHRARRTGGRVAVRLRGWVRVHPVRVGAVVVCALLAVWYVVWQPRWVGQRPTAAPVAGSLSTPMAVGTAHVGDVAGAQSAVPTATPGARPATPSRPAPSTTGTARPSPTTPAGVAGFPGPGTTGWQHTGVTLSHFRCTGEVTEITRAGTVIDGMDIGCGLLIRADNVTISRSRVSTGVQVPVRTEDGRTGVRIVDVEIAGQPGCIAGIGYMGWTAVRVDIHGCGDGVRIENGSTLQDSWIHDFWDGTRNGEQIDTPHHDGAQSTGGSDITIRHNRIDNPHDQTSCVLIGNEFGTPSNILIENNYLNGGNYSIYLAPTGSNRVIRNNTFTRNYVYGPASVEGQYVWTGNHYTDGTTVPP